MGKKYDNCYALLVDPIRPWPLAGPIANKLKNTGPITIRPSLSQFGHGIFVTIIT